MDVTRIPGHTRVLGVDQAYRPLPVRDEMIDCGPPLGEQPVMVSEWQMTPQERWAIANGAPVRLKILGRVHPPVLVEVGEAPKPKSLRPPFETFTAATCHGSYALGTACGQCEKCEWERAQRRLPEPGE